MSDNVVYYVVGKDSNGEDTLILRTNPEDFQLLQHIQYNMEPIAVNMGLPFFAYLDAISERAACWGEDINRMHALADDEDVNGLVHSARSAASWMRVTNLEKANASVWLMYHTTIDPQRKRTITIDIRRLLERSEGWQRIASDDRELCGFIRNELGVHELKPCIIKVLDALEAGFKPVTASGKQLIFEEGEDD